MKLIQQIFLTAILLLSTKNVIAQACCTAGTPLLSSLEMSTSSMGTLSLGLSTKYNSLTDVYTGSNFLEDQERERISQSYLLEISYGLTNKISLSVLFSYMRQTRNIQTITNFENTLNVNGIGDALFLVKYNLINIDLFNRTELAIGIGGKLPLGTSSVKENSALLPADMQPGTGSFDTLLWLYFAKGDVGLQGGGITTYAARVYADYKTTEGGKTDATLFIFNKKLSIMYQNRSIIDGTATFNGSANFVTSGENVLIGVLLKN